MTTKRMDKVISPGTVKVCEKWTRIFCHIEIEEKEAGERLSIMGVIGPRRNGNATGGCGQIDMEFKHKDPKDDDKRWTDLYAAEDMKFSPNWTADLWLEFLDIWKRWHLNNMRAECEHQRLLGWKYEDHHDPKTFKGELCPECGYSIGSQWLLEPLPQSVIEFLERLPDTEYSPAWV